MQQFTLIIYFCILLVFPFSIESWYSFYSTNKYSPHNTCCTNDTTVSNNNNNNNTEQRNETEIIIINSTIANYELPESENHLPIKCCTSLDTFVVDPDKYLTKRELVPVCLKCATCLALSDEIIAIFSKLRAAKKQPHSVSEHERLVASEMEKLCTKGFKTYDLREYNNNMLVMPKSDVTNHVKSSFDGDWTKILRSLCKNVTMILKSYDLYLMFKSNTADLTDYLCHGDGLLGQCKNLELVQVEIPTVCKKGKRNQLKSKRVYSYCQY